MGRKRGRKNGKNGKKSPPKKKYRTTKKAYTRRYVPLKEDPQPDRSRGTSHKEKDLNNWPEENMLPGHLYISHFPQIASTVCVQGLPVSPGDHSCEVMGYKPYGQACCQIHLCFGLLFLFFYLSLIHKYSL